MNTKEEVSAMPEEVVEEVVVAAEAETKEKDPEAKEPIAIGLTASDIATIEQQLQIMADSYKLGVGTQDGMQVMQAVINLYNSKFKKV